jgi:hypothetical protein
MNLNELAWWLYTWQGWSLEDIARELYGGVSDGERHNIAGLAISE